MILCSCAVNKSIMQEYGDFNTALENAISDFQKTRLNKKHNVFSVDFKEVNESVIGISILPVDYTYYITLIDTIGSTRLPTKHVVKEGKLFYWYDSDYGLTKALVDDFHQFNLIDSVDHADLVALLGLGTYFDDGAKGIHYYFCKNDLTKYKRVISKWAIEEYPPPKLRCK